MGKHTEAFNRQLRGIENSDVPSNVIIEFVAKMSSAQFREVCQRIRAGEDYTKGDYIGNREVYSYCKKYDIEPDRNPLPPKQEEKVDYSQHDEFEDLKIEGRDCFVMKHNREDKVIEVMFHDDSEIRQIKY